MAFRLIFDVAIPDDLALALSYYDDISPNLGDRFRGSVDRKLDLIAERPLIYSVDVPPIRFAEVDRFPYLIFFVPREQVVSVLAILHGSSDPNRWRSRLR